MPRVYRILLVLCCLAIAGCGQKEDEAQEQAASTAQTAPAPADSARTAAQNAGEGSPASAQTAPSPASAQAAASPASGQTAPPVDFAEIAAKNAEALKAMNQGKEIEPISTDALKGFLPATLAGMQRGESDARQMGMMGIKVASARADYQGGGNSTLEVMIMDVGNISGPMRAGLTGWTMVQVDQKTDTGYEKTTTYAGHKAIEEYDRQDQHGEFRVFVADRFIVEITGDNVTMETIKKAMGQIDLKKLAKAAN